MKARLVLFSLVCALVLSLSYGGKTMSNQNIRTWFELLAENATLLQGDHLTGSHEGNLEEILQLSIQMFKTGTTTLEELKRLGQLEELYWPKETALPDVFRFNTQQGIKTMIRVNLETKKIRYIRIAPKSSIDKNKLNIDNVAFIKNEFLVYEENNLGENVYSYHIKQKYYLKNNPDIVIEFWKDYDNDEKESFEYFKGHLDELHLFSDVVLYRQSEIKQ